MTDRRALLRSLADRVEKLDGPDCTLDAEIQCTAYPQRYGLPNGGFPGAVGDNTEPKWWITAKSFTSSYGAIASLPGPEVIRMTKLNANSWKAVTGNGAVGRAPTRLQAELAARLRGMAETLTEEK